ncbi:hypothetical protein [Anaerovorax odorimutans]|uniref:hypothetical protein n=1 Tax=Anaerovorax odorimutans TaxID=109327 RepID=UPI0004194DBF|nr:hypothetical protein [Anaerovorax odorimutans]
MTNSGYKKLLGFIIRNKLELGELLNNFSAEDIEKGILAIPQDLFNKDLKMLIMDKATPYLDDYNIIFSNGTVFIDATLNLKQLGEINAKYMLTIEDFTFNNLTHQITFNYQEDVKSLGNMVQSLALKTAALKGPYLKTAIEMSNISFAEVHGNLITLNLDDINFIKKIPSEIELKYVSSLDGILKFSF